MRELAKDMGASIFSSIRENTYVCTLRKEIELEIHIFI